MIEQAGGRELISACRMVVADWGNMSVFLSPPDCVLCDGGEVCVSASPCSSVLEFGPFCSGRFPFEGKRANGRHRQACNEGPPSLMIASIAQTLEGQETCLGLDGTVESG